MVVFKLLLPYYRPIVIYVESLIMKIRHLALSAITFFGVTAALSKPAYAGPSKDECAIWICLPSGFTIGCDVAFNAMLDRIAHFKPPLPLLTSCLSGPSGAQQSTGNFTHTRSRYEACPNGYFEFDLRREDIIRPRRRRRDGVGDEFRQCVNPQTGDRFEIERGPWQNHIQITIDGVSYGTYSFPDNMVPR